MNLKNESKDCQNIYMYHKILKASTETSLFSLAYSLKDFILWTRVHLDASRH